MRIQRSSDVIEKIAEQAFFNFGSAILLGAFGGLLLRYKGDGMFVGLAWVLILAAVYFAYRGIRTSITVKDVQSFSVECPICTEVNELVAKPENEDCTCVACNNRIPILNGIVLPVEQVRCGFCNSLNYYSSKTEILICETCNHEIPIFQEEGKPTKQLPKGYAVVDDNSLYELVLTDAGKGSEDLVKTLQTMLALNRNQVKDLLNDTPVTLLQGIPKMKADMLSAQIGMHGGKAESRVLQQQ